MTSLLWRGCGKIHQLLYFASYLLISSLMSKASSTYECRYEGVGYNNSNNTSRNNILMGSTGIHDSEHAFL